MTATLSTEPRRYALETEIRGILPTVKEFHYEELPDGDLKITFKDPVIKNYLIGVVPNFLYIGTDEVGNVTLQDPISNEFLTYSPRKS